MKTEKNKWKKEKYKQSNDVQTTNTKGKKKIALRICPLQHGGGPVRNDE